MLVTILFTGCENAEQIKPIAVFESDFTCFYNDMQIKGELLSKSDNSVEINVSSPGVLKGLNIRAKDDKFDAEYNGISVSYSKDDLPDGAFFKLILISLENIINTDDLQFEKQDEKYIATKNSELGEIKITLNKDFFIEKQEIPNQSFNIKLQPKNAVQK